MSSRVAVDIGGTFTDVIRVDEDSGRFVVRKTLTTPRDLIDGILTGLGGSTDDPAGGMDIVHGSTVVINALIERRGARTALVTTRGFRDVYEIGRINRPDAFNMGFEQHRPLIPREHVFEVTERMRADGSVSTALDEDEARELAQHLADEGFEAVAVVFLHGYKNPRHELQMGRILGVEMPESYRTLSHELTREYREFERTSTAVANAFVGPTVSTYLGRLEERLASRGTTVKLALMQSNGGIADVGLVRRQAVQMMESGPAGGVVGTIELCKQLGYRDAIAFDMGGTTAKASVIQDLQFPHAEEYFVGDYASGLPIRIPCLDIVEVGTGGGSIAAVDVAGGLRVGPRSAGAEPGPACYGRGGNEATVTDAAVVLGILSPRGRLSGGLTLDGEAAERVVAKLARALDLSTARAAAGVLAIAASSMANAVRAVTTERGLDPRDFALFAYGGNGPLHVSLVARELGIPRVVIPPSPAVFSALGMLMADIRRDVVVTSIRRHDSLSGAELEAELRELEKLAQADIVKGAITYEDIRFSRFADMRYVGQEHSLSAPIPDVPPHELIGALKRAFDNAHLVRFAHGAPDEDAEIVSLRVSAVGTVTPPRFVEIDVGNQQPSEEAHVDSRPVIFHADEAPVNCAVYRRDALRAGDRIAGPAAIEEPTTTTLLRPGDRLEVDPSGSMLLTIGSTA